MAWRSRGSSKTRTRLEGPATGADQLAEGVGLLLGRQVLALEVLDQVEQVGFVGADGADEAGNGRPLEHAGGGQAAHAGGEGEAVAIGADANRLLEAVVVHGLGQRGDVAEEASGGAAGEIDAVDRQQLQAAARSRAASRRGA
jgi:hypothetical protein